MAVWPWVVLPAMLTALVVRADAKLIGPYFALSGLVGATEGLEARYWYEEPPLRHAFLRRFVYPLILGFGLAWAPMRTSDIAATGLLAAVLLLWPAIYDGLPWSVARRAWQLPTLYIAFLVAYAALALAGTQLRALLLKVSDGDVKAWLTDQLLASALTWMVVLVAVPVFRVSFLAIRSDAAQREALDAEKGSDGTE